MTDDAPADAYDLLASKLHAIRAQLDEAIEALGALEGSTAKAAAKAEAITEEENEKLDP